MSVPGLLPPRKRVKQVTAVLLNGDEVTLSREKFPTIQNVQMHVNAYSRDVDIWLECEENSILDTRHVVNYKHVTQLVESKEDD